MIESVFFFLCGLVVLVVGANWFVSRGVQVAKKLNVSEFIIGVTFVAIGTSIPELISSLVAQSQGHGGIVIGNVLGSNIANICFILGISALICPILVKRKVFERDGYLLVLSAVLMYAFAIDGSIGVIDGIMLLFLYGVYLLFLFKTRNGSRHRFSDFLRYFFRLRYLLTLRSSLVRTNPQTVEQKRVKRSFRDSLVLDFLIVAFSMMMIAFGSNWVVQGVINLASWVGVGENVIALSALAFGTSLPELSVSVSAARKGLGSFVVGNVIGSNIANTLLILSAATVFGPVAVSSLSKIYLLPIMAFVTVVFVYMTRAGKITRWMGALLTCSYVMFIAFSLVWSIG